MTIYLDDWATVPAPSDFELEEMDRHSQRDEIVMEQHCTWIFDCPVHGPEHQALCWRAFEEINVDRWYQIAYTPIETTKAEREQRQWEMRE